MTGTHNVKDIIQHLSQHVRMRVDVNKSEFSFAIFVKYKFMYSKLYINIHMCQGKHIC